jgi:hypothetical protein
MLPLNVPYLPLRVLSGSALQDGQHTLRLASACALQHIRVMFAKHILQQSHRCMPAFGCLSSQGCLALHLASTVHGFGTLMLPILTPDSSQPNMAEALPHLPCFIWVFGNAIRGLQVCRSSGPSSTNLPVASFSVLFPTSSMSSSSLEALVPIGVVSSGIMLMTTSTGSSNP